MTWRARALFAWPWCPELIYRIHNYAEYNELPISIQNMVRPVDTNVDSVSDQMPLYDMR